MFSPAEFSRFLDVTFETAQAFLKNHRSDLFLKLRNGLYALRQDLPDQIEIANRLYGPSYVSFEYALSRYRIIPESAYSVTSATPKAKREFVVDGHTYEYLKIKKEAFRGYRSEKNGSSTVHIAEPEKALVDYLYFVDLKLKKLNDRLNLRNIKKKEVLRYASLFKRKSLTKLIGSIL